MSEAICGMKHKTPDVASLIRAAMLNMIAAMQPRPSIAGSVQKYTNELIE